MNSGRTNITLHSLLPNELHVNLPDFRVNIIIIFHKESFRHFPWPGIGRRNKLNAPVNYTVIYSVLRQGINGKYFQSNWSLISD